ncbi:hypothetical protein [Mycolicibacterium brumae]|uniref:DUF1109 domain-containing protein n=1 Tax=Mycolicibacterium brumae TaxID=85968 RepID=A0A2G5P7F9_9MYCO|nr:hypothetical protein [Mycolicibacterium brumae]MCV7194743.1 hypothetical protein [Mycolicibacterium brumae]PIB74292.1 hypothetical protein CQY22_013565 [Mycolicibacterium brumae]RWA15155.1 hypothetical protein MBRU_11080 [Mycolicibacterium brumae DSM 44177]UWW08223.1 divalent metal cation transporter [Mycolicibacterium brumae]
MSLNDADSRAVPFAESRLPRWWRVCMALVTVAAGATCLWMLAGAAAVFEPLLVLIFGLYALAGCGLVWLVLAVLGLSRYSGRRWAAARWALPPVLIVVVAALAIGLIPRLQWAVSRGAMERAADACQETTSPIWVGAIHLEEIRRMDGACHLFEYGSFMSSSGWVRLPDGPPAKPLNQMKLTHYDGDWYRFVYDLF